MGGYGIRKTLHILKPIRAVDVSRMPLGPTSALHCSSPPFPRPPFPGPENQLLPGVFLLLPQTCLGRALGNLKAGLGSGRVKGLDRPGRGTGVGSRPSDRGGGRWRAEPAHFLAPLGSSAGTRTCRLGSHDALFLKWHLLPLSCLSWRSGSCHVRRAAPALCLLPSSLPSPIPLQSEGPTRAARAGAGAWGRPATGGGGRPCAQPQANQFGN